MTKMILICGLFLFNLSFAQELLKEGIYSGGGSLDNCDIRVLASRTAITLNLALISNQTNRTYCAHEGRTRQFSCEGNRCSSDEFEVIIINDENFSYRGFHYSFLGKRAPLPANNFIGGAGFGFHSAKGRDISATDHTCHILTNGSLLRCDNSTYAERFFCPKAINHAATARVCESKTGKSCTIEATRQVVVGKVKRGEYDPMSRTWGYIVDLYCEVVTLSKPIH